MSIPDIVLEDLYRRIRELEEAVRKLQKGQQVYGPTTPFPTPMPNYPKLPYMPGPSPIYGACGGGGHDAYKQTILADQMEELRCTKQW